MGAEPPSKREESGGCCSCCCRCCGALLRVLVPVAAVLIAISPTARVELAFGCFVLAPLVLGGLSGLIQSLGLLAGLPAPVALPQDPAEQLCEAASLFREHDKTAVLATAEGRRRFKAACLRALPGLGDAGKQELLRRLAAGREAASELLRPSPMRPEAAFKTDWAACAASFGSGRVEEAELEGMALNINSHTGMRPLRARRVAPHEVAGALRRAEVVTFDGRGLLPERAFNTTMLQLNELHPDVALHATSDGAHGLEDTTCLYALLIFSQSLVEGGPGSMLEWLTTQGLMDLLLARICRPFWKLGELAPTLPGLHRPNFSLGDPHDVFSDKTAAFHALLSQGRALLASNINVLQLAKWTKGEFGADGLLAGLGLQEQARYAHNFLWLGASAGAIHYDSQDNVLIQITGESTLFVIPANCSFGLGAGDDGAPVTAEFIENRGPDFPFLVVRLRPGDGVAIPSNSAHAVCSNDPWRIGMNFFIEPRGRGKMQWPWAPANHLHYAGEAHLAMRDLWLRAVAEMWATRRPHEPPYAIHGQRQEMA